MIKKQSKWMQNMFYYSLLLIYSLLSKNLVKCNNNNFHDNNNNNANSQCDCIQFESTFGKEYGIFMSPDWPAVYEYRSRCLLYIFQAPNNHIVELTFDEFDLQRADAGCDYSDHVRLFLHLQKPGLKSSDNWNNLLCGKYSEIEPTYYSSGSMLSFQFHTTFKLSNSTGFRGTFRFLNKALFHSDGQLMANTQCDYIIRHDILARAHSSTPVVQSFANRIPPLTDSLRRKIHSADWDQDDDEFDELRTLRDRRKIRSFFLNSLPSQQSSSSASLVQSLEATFGPGTSVSAKGHFYSPQYPSTYPRYSRCHYHFQAKPGERIYLHFTDISLHRIDESCHTSLDVVNVYDGVDKSTPLIGQLCGTNYFVELTSTGPEVLVEFKSQGYISAKGFRAEFAFISTTVPSSPPTNFWHHFPGPDNVATGGASNRTNIPQLSSSPSSSSSSSTSVSSSTSQSISGQPATNANTVALPNGPGIGSSSPSCDFWFSSDAHLNGTFTSPSYPSPYPDNIVCRYHFVGGGKQRVQIVFRHFDVHRNDENARDCELSDSLTAWVSTGGQQERIDSFCGNEIPPRIMSNGARLTLEFNAKSHSWHKQQQQRRQHLQHHHHPNTNRHSSLPEVASLFSSSSSSSHNQHFQARQTNHASLRQAPNEHSTESSVAAYQRFTHQLQKAQRLKHRQQQNPSVSDHGDSDPEIDEPNDGDDTTGDRFPRARGFEAIYRFVTDFGIESGKQDSKSVCGFVFNSSDASTGTFGSPNYPGLYPKDTECHYFFYGNHNEQVHIQFHHFDVEGVVPCTLETASDYLEFSSVHSTDRRPTRHCGVKHPPVIVSEADFFRVTFKSNSRFDATGFQAVYAFRPRIDDNSLQLKKARSSLTTMIGSMSQAPETDKTTMSTPDPLTPTRSSADRCLIFSTNIVVYNLLLAVLLFLFIC